MHVRCLPSGACGARLDQPVTGTTMAGDFKSLQECWLEDCVFPEFTTTKHIPQVHAYLFNSDCEYDIIIGQDLLLPIKMDTCFSTKLIKWVDLDLNLRLEVPMKTRDYWHDPYAIYLTLLNAIDDTHDIEPMAAEIHDSKYEAVSPDEVARQQTHLTEQQQ